jgi:beta-D-xylosidase 4
VIGPHFNATDLLLSNYHGSRCLDPLPATGPGGGKNFGCIISPLSAIQDINTMAHGGWTQGSFGCSVASNDTSNIAAALTLAATADVVVLAMGIDDSQEREGLDRTITTLPGVQTYVYKFEFA